MLNDAPRTGRSESSSSFSSFSSKNNEVNLRNHAPPDEVGEQETRRKNVVQDGSNYNSSSSVESSSSSSFSRREKNSTPPSSGPRGRSQTSTRGASPADINATATKSLKDDLVRTKTGNLVSKNAVLYGAQNIELKGTGCYIGSNVTLRGDLAMLRLGEYCLIHGAAPRGGSTTRNSIEQEDISATRKTKTTASTTTTIIRPSRKFFQHVYVALKIGDFVRIGPNSVVQAASIGSYVSVGRNVVIGNRAVIHSYCVIEDDTVIPDNEVIPPFSIVSGAPMKLRAELRETFASELATTLKEEYQGFLTGMTTKTAAGEEDVDELGARPDG
ncbi:unnamed protein product [Amoebophrya sp. A120]|nr:unnamed protein product [Amoebophrya sp. A120]|eukprot:GSA120T00000540001.1